MRAWLAGPRPLLLALRRSSTSPLPPLARYALRVPKSMPLDATAPLLCAGITTYSPMKYYGLVSAERRCCHEPSVFAWPKPLCVGDAHVFAAPARPRLLLLLCRTSRA